MYLSVSDLQRRTSWSMETRRGGEIMLSLLCVVATEKQDIMPENLNVPML